MKKEILVLPLLILMLSMVCAEIVLVTQPDSVYYSGQNLKVPVKVISATDVNDFLIVSLICGSKASFSEDKFISLQAGEEDEMSTTIPLVSKFVGSTSGTCKVKVALGEDYILSDSFVIKNQLTVSLYNVSSQVEYSPEETITILGVASKENLESVNGVITLVAKSENEVIEVKDTVNNGDFKVQFQVPKTTKSGKYSATLTITEKDYLGIVTNTGSATYSFLIKQIPKNLEIVVSNSEINPGEVIEIKPIMHDQTGENIPMNINVVIKDSSDNKVIFEKSIPTGEFYSYKTNSSQVPATWRIESTQDDFSSSKNVLIKENKALTTEIINSTLIVTNIGNVFFNDTISIKISDVEKQVRVSLDVGKQVLYSLSAPSGVYDIEVNTGLDEDSQVVSGVALTGNAISIKEASDGVINFIANPIVWLFLLLIVGGFTYFVYLRLHKKSLFGHIYKKKNEMSEYNSVPIVRDRSVTTPVSSATISSSIKGEEQEATVVCLKVKNFASEIDKGDSNAKEVLQNITEFADRVRASTYENNGTFLFIFAPVKTKTFENDKAALDLSKKIKDTLDHHNRYFKQRIDYGIGINKGSIVAKPEGRNSLQFSSLGTFANIAKRIAAISKGEILLGESVKDKLMKDVAVEKHSTDGINYYSTGEVKDVSASRERVNEIYRRMQK